MEMFDLRRDKLLEILETMTAAELARKSGVAASRISSCRSGLKSIGEITARKIEMGARKPVGWLDGLQRPKTKLAQSSELVELQEVVAQLIAAGKMDFAEVRAMIAMLRAREGN